MTGFVSSAREETGVWRGNVCSQCGYESVALVPLRHKDRTLGLIHLADQMENKIPLEKVLFLERVGAYVGEVLHTFMADEALRQSEERYRTLYEDALLPTSRLGQTAALSGPTAVPRN
jgi:GAF domain-containing protein